LAASDIQRITSEEFDTSMLNLGVDEIRPRIAVAVSGGGDSLALVLLMQGWIKARGGQMLALTVDHQLRADSTAEAAEVQKLLCVRGIDHDILVWRGDKPATHVQELAREARYNLLLQACRERGFPVLAVAHNVEDQIETFWMRLAHGSGVDGLSAMAARRTVEGILVIRPVLLFPRGRLRETCTHYKMNWVEDPSNQNERFLRVKLRRFEEFLTDEGLTPSRLALTVQKLNDAREALHVMTERASAECVVLHAEGYVSLKMAAWKQAPREIQRRVLVQLLMMLSSQPYHAGFDLIEQTRVDLYNPSFAGKTLSGCEIFPGRGGDMIVVREADVVERSVRVEENKVWDRRFVVSGFHGESLEIGALGEAGLSELRKNMGNSGTASQKLEALPFKVKRVLPALRQGGNLLAVPHVSYYSPSCPRGLKAGQITFCSIYRSGVKIV
jgi:tRNA(Ile)-lysidine synthase